MKLIKRLFGFFMILISSIGCTKYDEEQIYIIKKGNHRASNSKYSPKREPSIVFTFTFTENHRYLTEIPDNVDKLDLNKLYGLTSSAIHSNSCRIGWREVEDGNFELHAYWYVDGQRGFELLYTAEVGEELFLSVSNDGDYYFGCNDKELIIPADTFKKSFRAFPYFGGDNTCPHEMYFKITEL